MWRGTATADGQRERRHPALCAGANHLLDLFHRPAAQLAVVDERGATLCSSGAITVAAGTEGRVLLGRRSVLRNALVHRPKKRYRSKDAHRVFGVIIPDGPRLLYTFDRMKTLVDRRQFLTAALMTPVIAPAFQSEKSKLKISGVRLVKTRGPQGWRPPTRPLLDRGRQAVSRSPIRCRSTPYKAQRSLFMADDPAKGGFTVEITTDKGIKGYGNGGPAGGAIVEQHLTKLLMNEDPFNIERLWDILWRSTMSYGRMGAVINAISGVDLALWDLVGNALGEPVYKLLGGETKPNSPSYCTGNDIEQHVEYGFKRLKLPSLMALPMERKACARMSNS